MSETTVICKECGERVPRKRFCCECSASLAIVTQPTTSKQSRVSIPVQDTDSATGGHGQSIDALKEPEKQQRAQTPSSTTPSHTATGTGDTQSFAEVTRSNTSNEGRPGSQQNSQGCSANNEQTGFTGITEKISVNVSRNDGSAANVYSETSKKVWWISFIIDINQTG